MRDLPVVCIKLQLKFSSLCTSELVLTDKVQSLMDSMENERKSRLTAEQRAQDASLRVDVLSSYFNEKEKEFDRCLPLITHIRLLLRYDFTVYTFCPSL